jgi:hypothetical protein
MDQYLLHRFAFLCAVAAMPLAVLRMQQQPEEPRLGTLSKIRVQH